MKGSESSVRRSGVAWRYGGGWASLAYLQSAEIVAGGNVNVQAASHRCLSPLISITPDLDRPGVTRRGCGRRTDFATICGKMAR
jgi:hypothetical protein